MPVFGYLFWVPLAHVAIRALENGILNNITKTYSYIIYLTF